MKKIDCLVLFSCLFGSAFLVFPLTKLNALSTEEQCRNNLKEIHTASRVFSSENEAEYPWTLPIAQGGSETLSRASLLWAPLSNFLTGPQIFTCPADEDAAPITSWGKYKENGDASTTYAVGTDAYERFRGAFLAADRNFNPSSGANNENCGQAAVRGVASTLQGGSVAQIRWFENIHNRKGNLVTSSGSVFLLDDEGFKKLVAETTNPDPTQHFVKPVRNGTRTGDN